MVKALNKQADFKMEEVDRLRMKQTQAEVQLHYVVSLVSKL